MTLIIMPHSSFSLRGPFVLSLQARGSRIIVSNRSIRSKSGLEQQNGKESTERGYQIEVFSCKETYEKRGPRKWVCQRRPHMLS